MREKKQNTLPERYSKGFLDKLDGRTEVYKLLRAAYDEVTGDMGGAERLSHAQVCLAERFCFLEFVLRGLEKEIAEGDKKHTAELLARWIQGLNSLTGLARTIGLERKARSVEGVREYAKRRAEE